MSARTAFIPMPTTDREFTYYRMGQVNGQGPVMWMFRFLRRDGGFGSCRVVEEGRLATERRALLAAGWKTRQ